jgi:hypothetical protein
MHAVNFYIIATIDDWVVASSPVILPISSTSNIKYGVTVTFISICGFRRISLPDTGIVCYPVRNLLSNSR